MNGCERSAFHMIFKTETDELLNLEYMYAPASRTRLFGFESLSLISPNPWNMRNNTHCQHQIGTERYEIRKIDYPRSKNQQIAHKKKRIWSFHASHLFIFGCSYDDTSGPEGL